MELNCRPGQKAWICVPSLPKALRFGLVQLHGHVIQTQRVMAEADPEFGPTWIVDPPQVFLATDWARGDNGKRIAPGTRLRTRTIPDAWLRPFPDFAPGDLYQLWAEVPEIAPEGLLEHSPEKPR